MNSLPCCPMKSKKIIKVIKGLLVKYASVTGITNTMVITDVYLSDMETITDLVDQ